MGGCLLAEHGTVVALPYYSIVALAPPYHGTLPLPLP